ncbi:hypothetical protein NWF32_22010 [Pseudomonas qingdaonensis]|nr:hypothetical protein [Pseudomonas qingdaonensis]
MADFIQEGHFARHIRKMRAEYAQRRSCLQQCLDEAFGALIGYSAGQAGLHLAVRIGAPGTARKMLAQAPAHGLVLRGGYSVEPDADDDNLLVLGYGGSRWARSRRRCSGCGGCTIRWRQGRLPHLSCRSRPCRRNGLRARCSTGLPSGACQPAADARTDTPENASSLRPATA